jgi:uncharacterized protein (DUF58 family)
MATETSELLKKIRKIEIKTKGISSEIFSGEYHSAFKGKGMAFSEVREYQHGDEIRTIDWNVTARLNHPYVKVFEEERELNVIILVDVSSSESFGTIMQTKKDLITELCAVLSFSAIQNNDKIGVILFSDIIEKFIPPKKGKRHILRIIRELIEFEPQRNGTDISQAVKYLVNVIKKRSIVFIVSDFISKNFDDSLSIISKKHDTIAINIYDKRETELPNIGLIRIADSEKGTSKWIDSSKNSLREQYKSWWADRENLLKYTFMKNKIDVIKIRTDESYIAPLTNFFKLRGKRY